VRRGAPATCEDKGIGMIITNRRGDVFLDFIPGSEPVVPEADRAIPLTHALVVARHQGKVLFIFNTRKRSGSARRHDRRGRDARSVRRPRTVRGEQPADRDPDLSRPDEVPFAADQRLEFGALYSGALETVAPFVANAESDKIILWDLVSDIGYVDEIDRKLVDFG